MQKNININCISPGFIETEMTKNINEEHKIYLFQKYLQGAWESRRMLRIVLNF